MSFGDEARDLVRDVIADIAAAKLGHAAHEAATIWARHASDIATGLSRLPICTIDAGVYERLPGAGALREDWYDDWHDFGWPEQWLLAKPDGRSPALVVQVRFCDADVRVRGFERRLGQWCPDQGWGVIPMPGADGDTTAELEWQETVGIEAKAATALLVGRAWRIAAVLNGFATGAIRLRRSCSIDEK